MVKNIIVMFNGLITLIFGTSVLHSGFKGIFVDYNRWIVGIGCVLMGIMCIYYSGIFQLAFSKSKKIDTDLGNVL
jgi:divalent metal cation (Fe/Co/Zn/Cd) transporter